MTVYPTILGWVYSNIEPYFKLASDGKEKATGKRYFLSSRYFRID